MFSWPFYADRHFCAAVAALEFEDEGDAAASDAANIEVPATINILVRFTTMTPVRPKGLNFECPPILLTTSTLTSDQKSGCFFSSIFALRAQEDASLALCDCPQCARAAKKLYNGPNSNAMYQPQARLSAKPKKKRGQLSS